MQVYRKPQQKDKWKLYTVTTWLPNLTVTTSVITRQPCRKDNFLAIIVSFVLASRPGTEFSGDISAIFAQI